MRKIIILVLFLSLIMLAGCNNIVNKCVKECSGNSYNIPQVRDHYDTLCSLTYNRGGVQDVERQIATCKENSPYR